jgi:hypothetical protein
VRYRNHQVAGVAGPTDRNLIGRRFRELGRQLKAGDRLIVFAEVHGEQAYGGYEYDYDDEEWVERSAKGADEPLYNQFDTGLMLWDSETVTASEFGRWLDRLDRDVSVVLIMGQCFAGGFSHAIFHRNDAELGLAPHARCGFFAQVHDRPAAGCTPDNKFQEYSSYFFTALGGKSPQGEATASADYDANGVVSFAEAHAYAIVESETFDVPVQTSGALLRRYSRLRSKVESPAKPGEEPPDPLRALIGALGSSKSDGSADELIEASGPLSKLAESARPWQRTVLERLPAKIGLTPDSTVEAVRVKLSQLKAARGLADARVGVAQATMTRVLGEAQEELYARWPELEQPYSPVAGELSSERAAEFVASVEALGSYEALLAARKRFDELADAALKAQADQAKAERLLQMVDEIVLAANLPKVAPAEVVERYHAIVAMEEQSLEPSK